MSLLDSTKSFFTGVNKAMLIVTNDENTSLGSAYTSGLQSATEVALAQSAITAYATEIGHTSAAENYSGYKILEVQYNPASLTFQASAKDVNMPTLNRNKVFQPRTQHHNSPRVVLAVDLMFDDMKEYECFVGDTYNSGVSSQSGINAVNSIADTLNQTTHSVQDITNGLVYAAIGKKTRNVIFKWADLSFQGDITQVEGKYTMFSTSGEPVRSEVKLQISKSTATAYEESLYLSEVSALFSQSESDMKLNTSWGNLLNWG